MPTVSKRDLNQHTAAVLAQATDTDDVVITERGQPRWRVSKVSERQSLLTQWEHEGRYTPPTSTPAPWPRHPGGPRYTDAEADALLDELRGDH